MLQLIINVIVFFSKVINKEQKKYLKKFKNYLQYVKLRTKGSTENFIQHYFLLKAELFALENKFRKAAVFYEKAIKSAAKNRFTYVELSHFS